MLIAGKVSNYTAVLRPAGLGLVAGDRLGLAVAFGGYAVGIDPEGCANVAPDAFGTAIGKFLIMCVAGGAVSMTGNLTFGIGEIHEEVANGFQFVMVLVLDVGLVGVEIDRQHGRFAAESLGSRGSLGRKRCRWWRKHNCYTYCTGCFSAGTGAGQAVSGAGSRRNRPDALWRNRADTRLDVTL